MRHGDALLALGVAQGVLAAAYARTWHPAAVALLGWSSFCFLLAGSAYRRRAPGVFGKRVTDGGLAPLARLLFLPYLLLSWGIWHVEGWLSRERRYDEVVPGLFLGRRPASAGALPPGTALVADLTAEFAACRDLTGEGRAYRCLPTLDGAAPPDESALRALVAELAASPAPVYVHCAQGHGRSALVVAAVLRERGLAADAGEAVARVRAARPGARLSREQYALLERLYGT